MANIINIDAETGANFIGDDAEPALTITNSSTGAGVRTNRAEISPGILAGNATITGLTFQTPSVASGAVMKFESGALVSAVSLIFAAGAGWAGMMAIRVVKSNGTFGWIPVLPDAQVTGAVQA